MIQTLSLTKAREDFTKLVAKAKRRRDEYVITVNGLPAAVIISVDEYESWKETAEILSDPVLLKAIREGEQDIKKGKIHDWDQVKKELKLNV